MKRFDELPSGNAGVPDVTSNGLSYYDLFLALLPVPLLVGALVGKLLWISTPVGVGVGALVSALALGHSLFRRPPTGRPPTGRPPTSGPSA